MKRPLRWLALSGLVIAAFGCDEYTAQTPVVEADDIPPAAVTDLALDSYDTNSVVLRWTAPGDDDRDGVAWRYDVRYADTPITMENWASANQIGGEPPPGFAGWVQVFQVIRLEEGHTYYFAIRTYDDRSNLSDLSNVIEVVPRSPVDIRPPSRIDDLRVESVASGAIELAWTAPGNDGDEGVAYGYEIRYSSLPLDESSFRSGRALREVPIPLPAGERQRLVIDGLESGRVYCARRAWD
ncbi:MAG: hypothetical protein KC729_19265, partial [Candidatus Eisenbacteria bacterium]|nr:hypothetical protein [Candidatus Eisenbacteria bacterium]